MLENTGVESGRVT